MSIRNSKCHGDLLPEHEKKDHIFDPIKRNTNTNNSAGISSGSNRTIEVRSDSARSQIKQFEIEPSGREDMDGMQRNLASYSDETRDTASASIKISTKGYLTHTPQLDSEGEHGHNYQNQASHSDDNLTKIFRRTVDVPNEISDWTLQGNYRSRTPTSTAGKQRESPIGFSLASFFRETKKETKESFSTSAYPQRSPAKSEGQDEVSFSIFNQSFDLLSETGNYLHEMGQSEDYDSAPAKSSTSGSHEQEGNHPPKNLSIELGNGYSDGGEDDNCSLGDISPIKLVHVKRTNLSVGRISNFDSQRRPSAANALPHASARAAATANSTTRRVALVDGYHSPQPHMRGRAHPAPQPPHPYGYRFENPYGNANFSRLSNPYYVLRCNHKAFKSCTYLLPYVKNVDVCPVNLSQYHGSIHRYRDRQLERPDDADTMVAVRRVEAAVCLFGGWLKPNHNKQTRSIFCPKNNNSDPSPRDARLDRPRQQYYSNGNPISWDYEDNPRPSSLAANNTNSKSLVISKEMSGSGRASRDAKVHASVDNRPSVRPGYQASKSATSNSSCTNDGSLNSDTSAAPNSAEQTKMKYRCKLCGQPKQNHNCPYQQSLQRSIGITVHPVVNAFTAKEPGVLTPALSQMNNFVSYDSDKGSSESAHTKPSADLSPVCQTITHVTPDTKATNTTYSPKSSMSASTETSPRQSCGTGTQRERFLAYAPTPSSNRKRSHTLMVRDQARPPKKSSFMATITLRPEHYRAVTQDKDEQQQQQQQLKHGNYEYPPVPLSFLERKRLSDTLFFLCRDVPSMSSDVAGVLSVARAENQWDLAVAELMAQVVVSLYCSEGDYQLDGLKQYLVGLGISC